MDLVDTADFISISDANRLGVSALVREAEAGHELIVLRNNKPAAVVVSIQRWEQLQRLQEDLIDLTLAAARSVTTGPDRYSLDEVFARFGVSREELRESIG